MILALIAIFWIAGANGLTVPNQLIVLVVAVLFIRFTILLWKFSTAVGEAVEKRLGK